MTNSRVPDTLGDMVREISAGGVVVRHTAEGWMMAAIEPQKEDSASRSRKRASQKVLLALPKGLVDPGEKPEQTAIREVHEETGVTGSVIRKLGDIKYTYVRCLSPQERTYLYLISPSLRITYPVTPISSCTSRIAYRSCFSPSTPSHSCIA